VPDARDIVDELTARGVGLAFGRSIHDPTDPFGRQRAGPAPATAATSQPAPAPAPVE